MTMEIAKLGGTSEVAEVLGCHKQQLRKLRMRPDFPQPIVCLAATPVWDIDDILLFRETWKRRQ
jgi:hypothetical protein